MGGSIFDIVLGKSVFSARLLFGISYGWNTGIHEDSDAEGNPGSHTRCADFHGCIDPGQWKVRIIALNPILILISPRKALKALLTHNNAQDAELTNESLQLAFVTARELGTSNIRFFEVVADLICQSPDHKFRFEETICLGLANLCHILRPVRSRALQLLEAVHQRSSGMLSLTQFEAAVGSSTPSTYLRAHRLVSDV